ncbi:MAG: SigE family RNA polymerase sigma factor [Pseudonocardiales bacterium]|nr:MAG: SigE family RNA polymerase sigma factor [Pseudonocardiales bacterium]
MDVRACRVVAPTSFEEFVTQKWPELVRFGFALTGEWASAEDLAQVAVIAVDRRRRKAGEPTHLLAFTRRVMVRTFLGWRRRRWATEVVTDNVDELATESAAAESDRVDVQVDVAAVLLRLPPRQRAVIALRYLADLSEADTAEAIGISLGAVKTHASRGLRALRSIPSIRELIEEAGPGGQ